MRRSVWAVTFVVAMVVSGCGSGRVVPPTLAEQEKPPYAEGVEVGKKYDYVLHTHCGIIQAQIDGTRWEADPPLVRDVAAPPPGWGNPWTGGTLRLLSKDKAEFVDGDDRATFRRADAAPQECQ